MLRTASSLPLTGLLTLGSDAGRFPPTPPACYRASWQLPGPDFHRQATTSLRTARSAATSQRHLPLCWAHETSRLSGRMPGQAVGAVGDVNAWQLGVEQQLPGRAELGDVGQVAPADEQVAVAGGLRVSLFRGQQALGLPDGFHQCGHFGRQIQPDGDYPAVAKQVAAVAAGLVVEQRVLVVPDGLGVVLVGEDLARLVEDLAGPGLEPERAVLAAEYPDNLPGVQEIGRAHV